MSKNIVIQLPDDLIRVLIEDWLHYAEDIGKFDASLCDHNLDRYELFKDHRIAQPKNLTSKFLIWIYSKKALCPLLEVGGGRNVVAESRVLNVMFSNLSSDCADYFLKRVAKITIKSNNLNHIVKWLELVSKNCLNLSYFHVEHRLDRNILFTTSLNLVERSRWPVLNAAIYNIVAKNCASLTYVRVDLCESVVGFDRKQYLLACDKCELLQSHVCNVEVHVLPVFHAKDSAVLGSTLLRVVERRILELEKLCDSDCFMISEQLCIQTRDEEQAWYYMRCHLAYFMYTLAQMRILIDGRLTQPLDVVTFRGSIHPTRFGSFENHHNNNHMTTPLTMTCCDRLMYHHDNSIRLVSCECCAIYLLVFVLFNNSGIIFIVFRPMLKRSTWTR